MFWEQQGLQTFGQRIQITRPHASQPAFERHLAHLMEEYGSIHAINLLGMKENEALLTNSYARHLQTAKSALGDDLGITHFDFHNAVRIGGHEDVIGNLPWVHDWFLHLISPFRSHFCIEESRALATILIGLVTRCVMHPPMRLSLSRKVYSERTALTGMWVSLSLP